MCKCFSSCSRSQIKNHDIYISNHKRAGSRSVTGGALGILVGLIYTVGFGGYFFWPIVCGFIVAFTAFATTERKTMWKVLSEMNDEERQLMATAANKVAQEWDMERSDNALRKSHSLQSENSSPIPSCCAN